MIGGVQLGAATAVLARSVPHSGKARLLQIETTGQRRPGGTSQAIV